MPHMVHLDEGAAWVMEGVPQPIAFGFTVCAGNQARGHARLDAHRRDALRRMGPRRSASRSSTLDRVDAEVLFPNRPWQAVVANNDAELHNIDGPGLQRLALRVLLVGARIASAAWPAIPNRGVAEAVAEVERTAAACRASSGFNLSCYPHGDATLSARGRRRVGRASRQTGKPIAIHIGLTDAMPFQLVARKLPGTAHFYDAPGRMLELIFGGVLDRFPGLRS